MPERFPARLIVIDGPRRKGEILLLAPGSKLPFGRAADVPIMLLGSLVSRVHGHLDYSGGSWSIVDQGSQHGLFVNGERVPRSALLHGDKVQIGEFVFEFTTKGPAEYRPPSERDAAAGLDDTGIVPAEEQAKALDFDRQPVIPLGEDDLSDTHPPKPRPRVNAEDPDADGQLHGRKGVMRAFQSTMPPKDPAPSLGMPTPPTPPPPVKSATTPISATPSAAAVAGHDAPAFRPAESVQEKPVAGDDVIAFKGDDAEETNSDEMAPGVRLPIGSGPIPPTSAAPPLRNPPSRATVEDSEVADPLRIRSGVAESIEDGPVNALRHIRSEPETTEEVAEYALVAEELRREEQAALQRSPTQPEVAVTTTAASSSAIGYATPVDANRLLEHCNRSWVKSVGVGATWVVAAVMALVIGIMIRYGVRSHPYAPQIGMGVDLLLGGLAAVATWIVCTPEPGASETSGAATIRSAARLLAVLAPIGIVGAIAATVWFPDRADLVRMLLPAVPLVPLWIAALHAGNLAARIPDDPLAGQFLVIAIALPLFAGLLWAGWLDAFPTMPGFGSFGITAGMVGCVGLAGWLIVLMTQMHRALRDL